MLEISTCIGCGARELLRDCTGDCSDHRVALVGPVGELVGPVLRAFADAEVARGGGGDAAYEAAYRAHATAARAALRALAQDETGVIEAWWCASCGRIEAPQPCIGVCIRHPQPHALVPAQAPAILRRLALTTPRAGQWQRSWEALQAEARASYASGAPFAPSPAPPPLREAT